MWQPMRRYIKRKIDEIFSLYARYVCGVRNVQIGMCVSSSMRKLERETKSILFQMQNDRTKWSVRYTLLIQWLNITRGATTNRKKLI